ncbi:MAG: MFS transporter [Candidatus Bathyarchaeia archaeon]
MKTFKSSEVNWGGYALVCLSHTMMHVFTQMHIALIPVFRAEMGLDAITIGLIASIPMIIQGLLTIPGGILADRMSRLRMVAVGLATSTAGGMLMTLANGAPMIIAFTSLFSVSSTLLHPPALGAVSEIVPNKMRGKAFGLFGAAGTFGIALGPVSLSLLLDIIGWRYVYLLWSIIGTVVSTLLLRFGFYSKTRMSNSKKMGGTSPNLHVFRNIGLILILAIMAARSFGGNAINTYITTYFVDVLKIEVETAIFLFGMSPLVGALASSLGGVMVDRTGGKKWFALGFVMQIISLLIVAFSPFIPVVLATYLLYSFFGSMEMPAEQYIIAELVPNTGRGLAFSLSFLPGTLVGSIAPVLVALVIAGRGVWYIFPFAITMFSTALAVLAILWRRI